MISFLNLVDEMATLPLVEDLGFSWGFVIGEKAYKEKTISCNLCLGNERIFSYLR